MPGAPGTEAGLHLSPLSPHLPQAEEDVESGEDAGVSRRNNRILMSGFSKRKV